MNTTTSRGAGEDKAMSRKRRNSFTVNIGLEETDREVYNLSSILLVSAVKFIVSWRWVFFLIFLQCNKVCMDFIQTRLGN